MIYRIIQSLYLKKSPFILIYFYLYFENINIERKLAFKKKKPIEKLLLERINHLFANLHGIKRE